jgi:hypothetical protein
VFCIKTLNPISLAEKFRFCQPCLHTMLFHGVYQRDHLLFREPKKLLHARQMLCVHARCRNVREQQETSGRPPFQNDCRHMIKYEKLPCMHARNIPVKTPPQSNTTKEFLPVIKNRRYKRFKINLEYFEKQKHNSRECRAFLCAKCNISLSPAYLISRTQRESRA